jgi:hypothetical protein
MQGILLDGNYDLKVVVRKDKDGYILQGMEIGEITPQRAKLIIHSAKGEIKHVPILGFNVNRWLKLTMTKIEKQQFIAELQSELSIDGIKANVNVNTETLNDLQLEINYEEN